ncbi:MAG: RDD family protein [Ktedonobacteraceae bacterium]|nr:RDD family protein [Ktedonobacteraceae bacterium]
MQNNPEQYNQPSSQYNPPGYGPQQPPAYGEEQPREEQPRPETPYQQSPYQQPPYGQPPYQQAPYGQSPYQQPGYGSPYSQQQMAYGQVPYQQAGFPNAELQARTASVGVRFVAILLDAILLGVVGSIIGALFSRVPGLVGAINTIIFFGYYIVMEATQGATLGKMVMGLRVVRQDGGPISWSESVIRNLLRIIDGLFFYLVGAILVWNSPWRQRLGDRAAKTLVIRTR